ncbi:Histidine biosynthesis bifunctional protein HisIE [Candidatus Lokiarchaeum ossiferum]|uniref:1-(5-phosphoribosyl)-5-[(5-phosphoribosylamino)methylideneamino] imidazole-4-carboxamide isomerase n=1 Tax=Candidatus Lokiarchaeum ossiferum TaxID=2951803 RepID=A0ABY6HTQ2_9ARCH|nr:Histidine biosynthesis bifunctional protein HisIE [Candidatus Lokiarchaeum sp. B-35]
MIIPSIDLMNGKAVQLQQGKKLILEREDIFELANEFKKYGEIAVIDLDAALGKGDNIDIIKKLCSIAPCRVGGGIRSLERANELLQAGAQKIIIGTAATPEFLQKLPKDRLIVAIDTKGDKVVNRGWQNKTNITPQAMIALVDSFCSEYLFTNVDVEGMMQGLEFKIVDELQQLTKNPMTVAGGTTTISDIKDLEKRNLNSQIGMAIYTGAIELSEAFVEMIDFDKGAGLVPTIVEDDKGQILMLAYSNRQSLLQTFKTGLGTYFSRSRKEIWIKGKTSSNMQTFITARYDCDRDTLLFRVKQENRACHLEQYSCFGDQRFSLSNLYEVITDRIDNPSPQSYTSKIVQQESLIMAKIQEESAEVVNYVDRDNLVWEISDLTYFLMVLMAKKGITPAEIRNELWRRRR